MADTGRGERAERAGNDGAAWDAAAVRRLRQFLGASQAELADQLGTRQQTVSEWETGASHPRRMSRRLLHLVAEATGYYDARPARDADADRDGAADGER